MSFFSQLRIMNYSLVSRTLLIYAFVVLIGSVSSSHVCSSGNRPKPHACAAGVEACAPPRRCTRRGKIGCAIRCAARTARRVRAARAIRLPRLPGEG